MKQDGKAGTPRHQNGPPEERPPFQFKNETEAYQYIIGRGRSPEQAAMLVAAAQMGHAIAAIMESVDAALWVVSERGPVSRSEPAEPPPHTSFVRRPPSVMSAGLKAAIGFADLGIEMIDATRRLVVVAKKMRALFDANPKLEEMLRHWRSPLQMMAASAIHAAITEKLNPPLGPKEMEAVALLIGYRRRSEEFPKKPDIDRAARTEELMKSWRDDSAGFETVYRRLFTSGDSAPPTTAETVSKRIETIIEWEIVDRQRWNSGLEEEEEEFPLKPTEQQEENWRKMMKKVEKELVPVLRDLKPVEPTEVPNTPEHKAT